MNLEEWPEATDEPPLEDQFEQFDKPRWSVGLVPKFRLVATPPVSRMRILHASGQKMIQLQPTRLHFNWLKTEDFKPSYGILVKEFLDLLGRFCAFVGETGLGSLLPNQWELTYVDAFFQDEEWKTPAGWKDVLPGLFGGLFSDSSEADLALDYRNAEWSFEIRPRQGRLHISARPGKWSRDKRIALILTTTARGPVPNSAIDEIKSGLDLGHEKAVAAFFEIVDKRLVEKWR